ncbi:MAG: Mut7-C ubiquitin/RNAse domain-containing protein [Spirochaetales bacterium]|nr:Mut7-C ubiquitin/RNAse domain-containing protein [Spirochaetales bacterium]
MPTVHIRFYEELNYFLPKQKRKKSFSTRFTPGDTVKNLIENLGVPHTEVDLLLANGSSVGFDYFLQQDDMISVYPVFESFDIGRISKVRPQPLRELKFILDVHLGTLAVQLRMLGFDTQYQTNINDDELAQISQNKQRILITRDRGLLKRKAVTHGYCIRSKHLKEQLAEIITRFDLRGSIHPFTRCLKCNTLLSSISKQEVKGKVPEYIFKMYTEYKNCVSCDRIYWKGSHWKHMLKRLNDMFSNEQKTKNDTAPER